MRAACRPRICLASRWNAGCAGVASGRGQHGRDDHTGALSTCTCASAMPASCDSINYQISCCSAAAGWRDELLQSRPSMISRIRDFTSLTSGLLWPPCFDAFLLLACFPRSGAARAFTVPLRASSTLARRSLLHSLTPSCRRVVRPSLHSSLYEGNTLSRCRTRNQSKRASTTSEIAVS